jgi:hypothetical protein
MFDPDKSIPLDLRRTAITRLPFERELTEAVCREVLATLILFTETTRADVFRQLAASVYRPDPSGSALPSLYHPAVSSSPDEHRTKPPGAHSVSWLALGPTGLMPATISPAAPSTAAFVFGQSFDLVPEDMHVRAVVGEPGPFFRQKASARGGALLVALQRWTQRRPSLPENAQHRRVDDRWVWAWIGSEAESLFDRISLSNTQPDDDGSIVFVPSAAPTAETLDPLTALWLDLLGTPEIPFDRAERSVVLARAFRELAPEIGRLQNAASTY